MLGWISPKVLPLTLYERKLSGEKGVIEEGLMARLTELVPPQTKHCIEFGARNPHTRGLVAQGFSALYIEGGAASAKKVQADFEGFSGVTVLNEFVTVENVESLFSRGGTPAEPYLLVIDIDGNDYHVWDAIRNYRPWFVSIEFNASYGPHEKFVIDYDPEFAWNGDDYFGASMASLVSLGEAKGYQLIHCTSGGDNLYFARSDIFPAMGVTENSCEAMYQLPQYGRCGRAPNGKGHPASPRTASLVGRAWYCLRYRLLAPLRRIVKSRMKAQERASRKSAKGTA